MTVTVEKAAAGGRMIARHDGAIVLVAGAIPGEVVQVEVEKVQRGTVWARTVSVIERSPDRVDSLDGACGGNVLAHVGYSRQLTLKRQIVEDAFARISRLALPNAVNPAASPVEGYRMRARLHVERGRVGFFREGTHDLCDPGVTRQLLPASIDVLRQFEDACLRTAAAVKEIELSENSAADERALHLTLRGDADPSELGSVPRLDGVRGISCSVEPGVRPLTLWGSADVTDALVVPSVDGDTAVKLTRQAHSFFQGNRYLLVDLVKAVLAEVLAGRVLDLYAGVGLFSVTAAASGHDVIAVEGDRTSAWDLKRNAAQGPRRLEVRHQPVETYLRSAPRSGFDTVIVDPPRTGMTREALHGTIALEPRRVVYVSCDVATLARDARILVDNGFAIARAQAFDLFPNTAHVESVVTFVR